MPGSPHHCAASSPPPLQRLRCPYCRYNLFARRLPGFELMLNCSEGSGDPMEVFAAKVSPSAPCLPPVLHMPRL